VSLASTIGATLAMLAAASSGNPFKALASAFFSDRGIERPLPVHHIPIVPFCTESADGFGRSCEVWTYFGLASWAWWVPWRLNTGTQVQVSSLQSILSPGLIGSFDTLACCRWSSSSGFFQEPQGVWRSLRPSQFDFMLVVIGAGAGSLVTAYIAAVVKAKFHAGGSPQNGWRLFELRLCTEQGLIRSATLAPDAPWCKLWFGEQ
jgi:hypothetical protein